MNTSKQPSVRKIDQQIELLKFQINDKNILIDELRRNLLEVELINEKLNRRVLGLISDQKPLEELASELRNKIDELVKNQLIMENDAEILRNEADSLKNTKSFRLGYALIFGFKSFKGFNHLLKTIKDLLLEKFHRKSRKKFKKNQVSIKFPMLLENLKTTTLVKPNIFWIVDDEAENFGTKEIALSSQTDSFLTLSKEELLSEIIVDESCTSYYVLFINAYSVESNFSEKQCLLTIEAFDHENNKSDLFLDVPFSTAIGKNYYYLDVFPESINAVLLPFSQKIARFELGLKTWDAQGEIVVQNKLSYASFKDGVSIIIPAYKSEGTIGLCIESLVQQSLDYEKFEIIVVLNGPPNSSSKILRKIQKKYPLLNLKVFKIEQAGAGLARNYGIKKAEYSFTTFIDADDYVSENYLLNMYSKSSFTSLVLADVKDVLNGEVQDNSISMQLLKAQDQNNITYNSTTSVLTMNACKLAPTYMVKSTMYDTNLRSGEDVVYWSQLLTQFQPIIKIVDDLEDSIYFRVLMDNSVSRQNESYDFNVKQRLQVIQNLCTLLSNTKANNMLVFIQSKINAQAGFIKRYLTRHPYEYLNFKKDISEMSLNNSFINEINALFSDTLIISYCYAPYADTSGIVMSKRINAMAKPVDVISNKMTNVRSIDLSLNQIAQEYLGKHIELNAPQAFANWGAIEKFAELVVKQVGELISQRPLYENFYSRAMWPASNFAAALLKMKYPTIKWTAEFSDPLLMDVTGNKRQDEMPIEWLYKHGLITVGEFNEPQKLFYWCERLVYLYADHIIFTNENQRDYMLSYADEELKERIEKISEISPQPTLSEKYYNLSSVKLEKNEELIYIAYFGSFYVNRGFENFFKAWQELEFDARKKLRLYVYTQQSADDVLRDAPNELKDFIIIQPYVGYFDFLALTKQFDVLLVMDAQTKGLKMNNPYLPSKLSDYLGSGTNILALVEENSPMHKDQFLQDTAVLLNDQTQIRVFLETIIT